MVLHSEKADRLVPCATLQIMTNSTPSTPPGLLYAKTRQDMLALARSLTPAQAATVVPMSPEWTVHDVVAHVTGLNADVVGGRTESLGSDESTNRQVSERRSTSLQEICEEWEGHASEMASRMEATPKLAIGLTGDLVVHLHDVQQALKLEIDETSEQTVLAAHRYVPHMQERVQERLGLGIAVSLTDGTEWPAAGDVAATLRTSPYDFLRSVTGRRSRRQVEQLDWTGDVATILDNAWSTYGPLQDDDVSA